MIAKIGNCRVLVTGGTGFLARHVIQRLALQGAAVRTSVRDDAVLPELRSAIGVSSNQLQGYACDLESDHNWRSAIEGCTHVIHCASPFPVRQPRQADALVNTAVSGTQRVLQMALDGGVSRVVVTSSMNAIAGGNATDATKVYTEADWTDLDDRLTPYDRSKTMAERAAWTFAETHPSLQIAVVNPGAIFGPMLGPHVSASGAIIRTMLEGKIPRVPRIGFGPVDVRDVADAHIAAIIDPAAAGQRYICSLDEMWLVDIARELAQLPAFANRGVPTKEMPDWLVRIGATLSPSLRRAADHLGRRRRINNSKVKGLLGRDLISKRLMIEDMATDLLNHGMVPR